MNSQKLKITNSSGVELSASLDLPVGQKPQHYAIFAHCFTCHSNLNAVRNISRELTAHGFAVVRFDFTGLGQSQGEFADSHFSANVSDLEKVSDFISEHYMPPSLLVGHSLGGAAVLVAASRLDNIKAVATIGAPAHVSHVKRHFSSQIDELSEGEVARVNIGGRPFNINRQFVEDFDQIDLPAVVHKLKKPVLIFHSPFDKIVGIENASILYDSAFHPKSFVSLDSADHLLTQQQDSMYVGTVIGAWAQRYFAWEEDETLDPHEEQLVGYLDLREDNFTTTIQTDKHTIIADEPVSVGGDNLGPSPYDLLSASLAACTTMTLKMYANRKGWDLQEVYVYVTYSKKHGVDMDVESGKKGYMDHIIKKLKFVGELSEEQKDRLKEISSRCPVHKTLSREVVFETEVID